MSTRWGSWEKVGDIEFPKTLSEAFDLELSEFEINHGYYFTLTILSLLVLSRDGLTISELEDIISLDNLCLCESLKVFETDLARIPPLKVTQFLHDINDYVVRRQDFGGELISIAHDHDLVKCIEERYLSDREIVDRISNLLLDYFSDKFSEEYPFTSIKGRDFLPSRLILGMPWRYPPNELCEKAFGTATTWNVRKLRELPHACLMADNWIEFDRLLHDVHYVTGILSVQSTDRAIEEVYSFFVHDPKKYRPDRQSRFAPQSEPKLETDAPKLELEDGDIKVEESEPEQHFVVTPRIKVLIFLETFLDFLVWCRHIMDLSPQETRKSVVFDMLFRLPESSNLKGVLYRTISQSELVKSGNWDKFNLLQSCGYGILQCISSWRPIISVSGKVWSARLPPLITNPDGETRSDIDVSTMPDWSSARQKSMTLGSSICTIDGEYNYEQWDQTHIKPSMTILHRNHTHSACSSDGKYIASSSNDGFVKVFDASTGFELTSLNTIGKVMAIAFQAQDNDNLLISVALSSSINKLLVWSMSKCQVTHEVSGKLMGLGVPIVICGFLKDIASQRDHHHHQQLIIYGLGLNGVLTIWELNTSVIVKQFYPDSDDNKVLATGTATASSDGKFIVYGIRSLNLINVKDLSLVWTLKIQPDKSDLKNHVMNRLIFSQDSKTVFILSSSYKTSIQSPSPVFQKFDLTNKVTSMLWPLEINANDMAITPDEECVAFGSESGIAHIVSLKSGSLLVCQALAEPVNSMIVIPEIPSSTYSSSTYSRKTNWTGNMKEEDKCYILGIGSFKTGINLFGFENSRDSKIRHSISTAQLSPDGSILAVVGGSEVPHLNYDASCFIQAPKLVRVDGEVVSSLEDIQALTRQARSLQAATSVPGKSGTTRGRSVSLERRASKIMAKTQQTPLSDPTKENVKKSYFDEPKDRSTVTLWDVETGSRLFKTDYKGKVVWVDFETKTFGNDVSSFVTGDTGGEVKIWNWNTIGQVNEGKVCRNWASTAVSTEIETLSFNVANGLSNATVMNYCLNRENGILAVLVMEESGTLKAQFWTTEKGERVESHEIRIESGPIFNMTKSGLSIPMCWGNPSDALLRFVNTQHAVSAHTIRPACLTVGLDRLHISIDFAQSRSESIKAMVECRIGSTYTATCQSKADPRLMVIAVSDKIYLIYEEMFPVIGKPTPIAPYHRLSMAVPSAPDSQRASVSAKDKKKGKSRNNLVDIKKSSSNLCKSTTAIKEKEKDGIDSASDTFSEPARSHRPSLAPIEKEYVPSPSDFCRIRTFKAVEGETVIGLHHFKTDLSDVLISATSNGTVVVYDLKLNTRKTGIHHQVIDEPVKIIGIWHARAPISGMQVTEVVGPKNEDEEESDDEEYSRCRVVVWGLNGFVSVLNLQL
ncbi:hypothetical protein HDU99_004088 [Rhizoclosmatium hyalinum]|nr:hypothetical protein HDU99_004088 [Rhizoclosmatium hyalinum]